MDLFRGSWNVVNEDDKPLHSPVRLLQKISAYRASTSSPSTPSPQNERKATILSESTNFFTRLWRPTSNNQSPKSPILITAHETASSSSFDHIPEPTSTHIESSSNLSPASKPNRRMSFMREISSKSPTPLFSFPQPPPPPVLLPPPPLPPVPLQPQPTTSSTITEPSFEDTTSEHPCDTTSEFYSQSFETNPDSINSGIDNQQQHEHQGLTYDERHRRLSFTPKPLIPFVQSTPRVSLRYDEQDHNDSLPSPEANIDVSMAMDYFSTSMIMTQMTNDNNNRTSLTTESSIESNNNISFSPTYHHSDTWARKRALMNRGYQWTTTFESGDSLGNNSVTSSTPPFINSNNNSKIDLTNSILRRRRSSRRLPEIPISSSNTNNNNETTAITNIPDDIIFTSSSYSSTEYPSQPIGDNSISNRSNRSKSIDSESSLKNRSPHTKLLHTHQSQNAKSVDISNLTREKSFLPINNNLLPQRSLDYPCIVRKPQDLADMVRRRMLYSKISKQQQGENFSLSLEREHVPKVPRKIIIRQDNSIEIALSKPPKLRRQTLSEDYYYGVNPDAEFVSIAQSSNTASTLGVPIPSSASGLQIADRRKTIETCENIFLQAEESSKLRARTPPSNPHRILLHRDKSDTSIRTNGLGMRIVGGQECEDGSLGCFVTNVLYGGPADIQGNIEVGDQILEFNGHSLIDSTYEEVRILQDHCGDIAQLVVQHNNIRLQINGGQTLSSMEISRHFETVPRLASSITRKRRNLPPLPPSLSSSFPKQQKRALYETVETLEVPNVKELKPILINRGRLLAQIWHDIEDLKLALTVIQASNLPLRTNGDQPYTYITGKMLFEDRGFDMFETKVIHSSNPVYNETFVFHEVETVDGLHLEIFMYDKKQYHTNSHIDHNNLDETDEFLGMIQLPLTEANLEDEPRWYELRDRQTRKPSTSSVTFKSSSIESGDSIRKMPPLLTNTNNNNKSVERTKRTSGDLLMRALNRSTITNKIESNQKMSTIPSIIMTSIDDDDDNNNDDRHLRRTSTITVQSVKLKRRISKGILKFFDINTRRFSSGMSKSAPSSPQTSTTTRKSSSHVHTIHDSEDDIDIPVGLTFENTTVIINKSPRHSIISSTHQDDQHQQQSLIRPIPLQQMPIGQLMLPYIPSSRHSSISGSRKSSAASYIDSDDDIDRYFALSEQQQQQNNENNENSNVQTHMVGPGQVTPRNYENMINDYIYMGQIQLGLLVTKGLLEIDVICARGLERVIEEPNAFKNENTPPDTYVKTYLRTGTRRVQKRKTITVKGSYNPEYHTKLKYNACNVMGRRLQVTVWQRGGKFEKNQCIGEAFIQLDNLTLTQHTIAWYKLFREKLVESEFYDSS